MKKRTDEKRLDDEERFERDRAPAEARMNATRGAFPKPRPFRIGCALFVLALFGGGVMFAVALVAAVCAHRWGLA